MSDPVSGTSIIVAGGLMGAGMFGLVTGIDYGVVFGAADLFFLVLAGVGIDGGQRHHRFNANVGIGKNAMHSLRQFRQNDLFSAG